MAEDTSSSVLQLNDPVFVQHTTSTEDGTVSQLEGVISYIGPVPELRTSSTSTVGATTDAVLENDIYYGVRLTGSSVGMVSSSITDIITKRILSKLEALRLRRELASSTPASTSSTTSAVTSTSSTTVIPPGQRTPPRAVSSIPSTAAASSTPSATAGTTAMSRLEELRLRREALKAAKQQQPAPTISVDTAITTTSSSSYTPIKTSSGSLDMTSPEPSPLISGKNDSTMQWQNRIDDLTQQLLARDKENINLNSELLKYKQENQSFKVQVLELQQNLATASQQAASSAVLSNADTTKASKDSKEISALQDENSQLHVLYSNIRDQLEQVQKELTNCQVDIKEKAITHENTLVELTRSRAEATSYQNQLRAQTDQNDQRGMSDAVHYKERAKLSADISALKRKVEQLEKEKMEFEAAIEDITLDKEQLQEEKDAIEEKYEDLKLDAETAQMEVEELRIELEDAKATAGRVMGVADTLTAAAMASAGSPSKMHVNDNDSGDTLEMIQTLQTQNARLREALIRLREQSALEKMEMTRQFRSVEKAAETNTAVHNRVEELTAINENLNEQVNDLKDMVEQGAAFESMVEDLSDRVLGLEEQNVALHTIIRELEEAAELTAEMEEVQADELKALSRDLEGRDTMIRNLEEAIKMQRRREDDFRRTVGNYKATVDTLRREKQALLELQQGGEGEKNNLVVSSQKALSRAAQLVSEAANMRKREAEAVMDRINQTKFKHMSNRLESMLPQNLMSIELTTMKGEIMASTVCGKASHLLSGINSLFRKHIKPSLPDETINAEETSAGSLNISMPDELQQEMHTVFHQTDFGRVIAEMAADIIRLLAAGQWPDLLSTEASTQLGGIIGHNILELDEAFGVLLKTLKEEGSLAVEQTSVGALQLTAQKTIQAIRAEMERDDKPLVESSWNPPGWSLMRDVAIAKSTCFGTAAAVSMILDSNTQSGKTQTELNLLYSAIEQTTSLVTSVAWQLRNLDLMDAKEVGGLSTACSNFLSEAISLKEGVKDLLMSSGDIDICKAASIRTLHLINKIATELRSKVTNISEGEAYHPLSPEHDDHWGGVTALVRSIRSMDGDSEDVNFFLRAKAMEHRLSDAVDNEPKLQLATAKITGLESSLSSRSKELAIQNARLSELEKLIAKSSSTPLGRGTNFDFRTSDEYNNLQEENRVLTEAMDVLQREVEMYENEIRSLKDFKSPKRGNVASSRATPNKSGASLTSNTPTFRSANDDSQSSISLEATLFRPALQQALQESAHWKAVATGSALLDLAPLPTSPMDLYGNVNSIFSEEAIRLSSALAKARIEKATITLVDLRNKEKAPRAQLREMKAKSAAIAERLETVMLRCRGFDASTGRLN